MKIEKAKQEVATDIGQMLCVLAGNVMMEDREAGYLLARQLQPIMDYIKTKYLPDLPRKETVETMINQQGQEVARAIFEKIEALAVIRPFHEGQPDTMYFQLNTDEWQAIKDGILTDNAKKD